MSKDKPEWKLAKFATIVDAKETTFVHARPSYCGAPLGSPIGCIVRVYTPHGEPYGWQAYAFTSGARRAIHNAATWLKVGDIDRGTGAKARVAESAWGARAIEVVYPAKLEHAPPSSYGGRRTRAHRRQA